MIPYLNIFVQAIIESDPFGIDYKTAENEKTHGNSFASKLCEWQPIAQLIHSTVL